MRKGEYKQTGTRTEEKTVLIPAEYDDDGTVLTEEHEETITVEVPVFGMVYRSLTPEEEQELQNFEPEEPQDDVCEMVKECREAISCLLEGRTD